MIFNSQMNVLSKILFTFPQRKHHSVIDPLWLLISQKIEFQMLCPITHEGNNNSFQNYLSTCCQSWKVK